MTSSSGKNENILNNDNIFKAEFHAIDAHMDMIKTTLRECLNINIVFYLQYALNCALESNK